MSESFSRRTFLKRAGAASAFTIIPARILRSETAPSNQLTRALLGFGGIALAFLITVVAVRVLRFLPQDDFAALKAED